MDVGNLISGSSDFSKTSLNNWKFTVHVWLKAGLDNFEHYFVSMRFEWNFVLVSDIQQSVSVFIFSHIVFPCSLLQSTDLSSLCYIVGPC